MQCSTLTFLRRVGFVLFALVAAATFLITYGPVDPGRVHGQDTVGGALPGLTQGQLALFNVGSQVFATQWDPVKGLGPVYIQQSCAVCHNQPVEGGTNATLRAPFFGALNGDGSFDQLINEGGDLLQKLSAAKFILGCRLRGEVVPPDASITSNRLSPELFGDGLIDSIDDASVVNNSGAKGMGIDGDTNMVRDFDGKLRVGHFGVKAQFASLVQTTGHIFSHYIGITNPVNLNEDCPNARPGTPSCPSNIVPPQCSPAKEPNDRGGSETLQLYDFAALLAPVAPGTGNANGQALFTSIGCALCHTPTYTTPSNVKIQINFMGGRSPVVDALSNQQVNLYSDLLIHHMGPTLADCIQEKQAAGDQWRSAPLWGLSTRTTYLHDGRTTDLNTAIQLHKSTSNVAACGAIYPDSEANAVIDSFNALSPSDQADIITFLKSL